MPPLNREDIQLIASHSNWPASSVQKALTDHVYNDKPAWQKFLHWLFLGLGIGFITTGILFFFAWNWDSLHKFVKIGLVEGLIILLVLMVVFARFGPTVKHILLTSAAVLVGVLMAVFGQVYQTGANAYDLFLNWTLAISLWVAISGFIPLWVVYITLINITLCLYEEQVANNWPRLLIWLLLFLVNSSFLTGWLLAAQYKPSLKVPAWFHILLALTAVTMSTLGMITGLYDEQDFTLLVMVLATGCLYTAGFIHGLRRKSLFYLSLIAFSLIVILAAFFIKLSDDSGMFLFTSLFIIAAISFLVKKLIDLQKKWTHEASA